MKATWSSLVPLSAWAPPPVASYVIIYVRTARAGGHVVMVGNDGRPQVGRRSELWVGQVLPMGDVARKLEPAMRLFHQDSLPQASDFGTHRAEAGPSCVGGRALPWLTRQLASSHAANAVAYCMPDISAQGSQDPADDA